VNPWEVPTLVDIPVIRAERGAVGVVESDIPFPFDLKRVYYLFDVPSNAVRGSHAHKKLNQLIIAISGSFRVDLQDRTTRTQFLLSSPGTGLTVPPGYWRTLSDFSAGSAALVFASDEYDPDDYIRDFAEFQAWASR
jgi:dTDP-4-dehydrorhamnose 3,5-epimerase-like enzyme